MKAEKDHYCLACIKLLKTTEIERYCAECGDGPFCEKCFDIHMDEYNKNYECP